MRHRPRRDGHAAHARRPRAPQGGPGPGDRLPQTDGASRGVRRDGGVGGPELLRQRREHPAGRRPEVHGASNRSAPTQPDAGLRRYRRWTAPAGTPIGASSSSAIRRKSAHHRRSRTCTKRSSSRRHGARSGPRSRDHWSTSTPSSWAPRSSPSPSGGPASIRCWSTTSSSARASTAGATSPATPPSRPDWSTLPASPTTGTAPRPWPPSRARRPPSAPAWTGSIVAGGAYSQSTSPRSSRPGPGHRRLGRLDVAQPSGHPRGPEHGHVHHRGLERRRLGRRHAARRWTPGPSGRTSGRWPPSTPAASRTRSSRSTSPAGTGRPSASPWTSTRGGTPAWRSWRR